MIRKTCLGFLVLAATLIAAGNIFAAEQSALAHGGERHLGGHSFLPSRYVEDPFVSTRFTNHVGGASAPSFSRDFNNLDGNFLFTLTGKIAFASLGMSFQQHLGTNWAVGVAGSGLVRSGTNALSFIDDGANLNTNMDLWTKRLLRRTDNSQLTAGISWRYSSTTIFTPRQFAQHLIDGGSLATAPFVQTGHTWDLQADLMWAHAFNATYGLRAQGSLGVAEQVGDGSVLLGKNRIGVLGEVDFKAEHNFPLGLTLGHFIGIPSDRIASGLGGTVLGFWYTGKEEFLVGLETGWIQIPIDDQGGTIDGAFSVVKIEYYF